MLEPALFWAKSNAGGRPHSVVGHLLDTGAVGGLIWNEFLAPGVQRRLDDCSGGRGRDLLVLACVWHDLGKATPAFQAKAGSRADLLQGIREAGLDLGVPNDLYRRWHHTLAGTEIADRALFNGGVVGGEWLLPIIVGHHGRFNDKPTRQALRTQWAHAHGDAEWRAHQLALAELVAARLDINLDGWHIDTPDRGLQLALAGLVVMADWIASSSLFPGLGLVDEDATTAHQRAADAWRSLGLRRGWDPHTLMAATPEAFAQRAGLPPRPVQTLVIDHLSRHPDTGLLIVEAPMGEGKTEASFAAAELLASANGCDGICYAMPTQGTTDAMYPRLASWLERAAPGQPISLLHGKNMLNEPWRRTIREVSVSGICDEDDEFGVPLTEIEPTGPSQWLLGRHRGLLAPFCVATIDQLLWAATNATFVQVRHAGLAGRVLVIDEVHSYDVYMGTFLTELLRWCARAHVPVVLMSATLSPELRQRLVAAWREGRALPAVEPPQQGGYPCLTSCDWGGQLHGATSPGFRDDIAVGTQVLATTDVDDTSEIARAVLRETHAGGVALVICNLVARAQGVYEEIRRAVGSDHCLLINGRLTAAQRADRTQRAIELLGDHGRRPDRFIVVATQIAEQSFDVDADILFSDLCPMDLLLQRIGRLHRHLANNDSRPAALREPRCIVTGLSWDADGVPIWPRGFAHLGLDELLTLDRITTTPYRAAPLLATAAQLRGSPIWQIPSQVPALVSEAYDAVWTGPDGWLRHVEVARRLAQREDAERTKRAETFRLDPNPRAGKQNLWGQTAQGHREDSDTRVVVRDGQDTIEVALVRQTGTALTTMDGVPLGVQGERANDDDRLARLVLGDQVRIPALGSILTLKPLPRWEDDRNLGHTPALLLDGQGNSLDSTIDLHYDDDLGVIRYV